MYFTDITTPELQYFHGINAKNFNISLSEMLSSDLFIVEHIITDSIYRIYPIFYSQQIISSNPDDKILENKCIIANKTDEETYYRFISDDKTEIILGILNNYKEINETLNVDEFNNLVYRLKHQQPFKEEIQINNSTVHGLYADYVFDLASTTIVDNGILITNETLTNIGTITLVNPVFKNSTYTIKMKVYSISDVNVCSDASADNITVTPLTITLQYGVPVNIPFETLDLDHVIGFDATINIIHDQPIIKVNESLILSSNISSLTIGETAVLSATYLDETGMPMSNQEIRFYDGETLLSSSNTNEYGVATFNFIPSVSGNHNISCKNSNDLTSNTVSLIVSKKIPVLTLSASRRGAGLNIIDIEASIKYEGVGISGVTLQVLDSSDNVVVSTLTNSSGEISDMITSYDGYTLRAYYAGDATYNSAYSSPVTVNAAYTKCSITEVDGKTILSYNDGDKATLRVQLLDSSDNPVAASGEPVEFWTSQNSHYPALSMIGNQFEISRVSGDSTNIKMGTENKYLLLTESGFSIYDNGNYIVDVAGDIINVRYMGDGSLRYTDVYDNSYIVDVTGFYFINVISASGTYVFNNLLHSSRTDRTGKADISYRSRGDGDIGFYAVCGTVVSETFSIEDCLLYQDMATILSNWSKDTSVSGRTIYKLTPNYQSDVELTFKIANSVPSNFLCGFGETGTGSPIYWGKAMFHNENGTLWYFVDNSDIRLGTSTSTNTVFKLTTESLHKVNAYLDDSLQAYRDTNTSRGLNLRIDSYTASPLTLEYLKVKPL